MGFNYAKEKLRFEAEWKKLSAEYSKAGFDTEGIQAMYEHDWKLFKQRRSYENRVQALPCEDIDDDADDSNSRLFQKFGALSNEFSENDFTGRFDWIMAVTDSVLADKLAKLSDDYKELLTLLVFDGYTQTEIANLRGCSQVAICKKINRIKNILKSGL